MALLNHVSRMSACAADSQLIVCFKFALELFFMLDSAHNQLDKHHAAARIAMHMLLFNPQTLLLLLLLLLQMHVPFQC